MHVPDSADATVVPDLFIYLFVWLVLSFEVHA